MSKARKPKPLYCGAHRWFWYFDGITPETRDFVERLTDEEWKIWESRYRILWFTEKQIYPPLQPWEKECFEAALKLAEREPDPRLVAEYDPLWEKLDSKFVQ